MPSAPLKALIWADGDQIKVSFTRRPHWPPATVSPAMAANLAGINALTDALVAS